MKFRIYRENNPDPYEKCRIRMRQRITKLDEKKLRIRMRNKMTDTDEKLLHPDEK